MTVKIIANDKGNPVVCGNRVAVGVRSQRRGATSSRSDEVQFTLFMAGDFLRAAAEPGGHVRLP
jgi:hypothetical protein